MKKIIAALLLLVFVFSCQKEDIQNEETQAIDNSKTQVTAKSFSSINDGYSQREILEINLRWTSYITGSVLRNDASSRLEVAALLQNGNNVIRLNQLFGNGSAFETKFYELTNWYLFMGYPNHDKTRPNPPPQGIGGGHSNLAASFMNYILNTNCIELYFPKSMIFTGSFEITTTGHPMNDTDNFNDGIVRYYNPVSTSGLGDFFSTTHDVTVNANYVQHKDNIIIARPYRNTNEPLAGNSCNYIQYDDISDFTDFLAY